MTKDELDYELRKLTDSELKHLNEMKQFFGFKSNEDIFNNYEKIKHNYQFKHYSANKESIEYDISFKKHGRFNQINEHNHAYIEMSYVYSGTIHEIINGKSIALSQGDLIILDTNVRHTFEVAGYDDILINFMISPKYFHKHFFKADYDNNIVSNFIIHTLYETHKYNDYLLFHTTNHPHFHHLISYMIIEQMNADLYSLQNINHYLMIIFNELIRIYDTQEKSLAEVERSQKTYRFLEMKDYIEKNYENLDLETAAQHFHFHPNYFSQYIKQVTGDNFKSLIIKERIKKASHLLLQTDLTIESICYESGFTNMNTFYKKFKDIYQLTPKKYRTQKKGQSKI
ncbi:hypothetical protein HMPREF9488_00796 [Coprobacillus cateniformis]|jgi:AraC-like DNA-binding protein/quercetin dioxygenase-like cupin family protein|uniref:HTH araC/xylS-type domain-containing protein n=1 Tax=Coprobacillus cateniformis TaxID=100884 RepID=E7G7Q8_9FIRM|nr:helix-turn-helix domain-containing protein [Coprobacillus cateniformis]EFW05829.1 hypothetical protein HMPREF9488_00796 [Coprobacillus cateniformis]